MNLKIVEGAATEAMVHAQRTIDMLQRVIDFATGGRNTDVQADFYEALNASQKIERYMEMLDDEFGRDEQGRVKERL